MRTAAATSRSWLVGGGGVVSVGGSGVVSVGGGRAGVDGLGGCDH